MVHSSNAIKEKAIPLSITQTAIRTAQQFANLQPTEEKQQQVYLNTLAVYVVKDYMQMMEIPTDLNKSDSWNQALRLAANVADLMIPGLGHLECRPVTSVAIYSSATPICQIPPEVPEDRIGLVIVELDPAIQQATLLGFSQTVESGELALSQLRTIDDLLEHLEALEHLRTETIEQPPVLVQLSQWLQQRFEVGWQSVESLLGSSKVELAFGFRETVTVKRAKQLNLGSQLVAQSVVLVVTLTSTSLLEKEIMVEVQPGNGQTYLPEQLHLMLLDGDAASVMEAVTKSANKNIQLQFSGQPGEQFSIKLTLGEVSVSEDFVI